MNRNQLVSSVLIGAYVAVIFVVIITIAGELYKVGGANVIKDYLKGLHGHHWVGKGIWAVGTFLIASAISYFVGRNKAESTVAYHAKVLAWVLALGTLVLYGFFTYEYLIH